MQNLLLDYLFFLDDTFDEAEKIEKLLLNKNVVRDIK